MYETLLYVWNRHVKFVRKTIKTFRLCWLLQSFIYFKCRCISFLKIFHDFSLFLLYVFSHKKKCMCIWTIYIFIRLAVCVSVSVCLGVCLCVCEFHSTKFIFLAILKKYFYLSFKYTWMSQDSLMLFIFSWEIKIKTDYYSYYIDKNVKKRTGEAGSVPLVINIIQIQRVKKNIW